MKGSLFMLCLVLASTAAPAEEAPTAGSKPAVETKAAPAMTVDAVIDRYLRALGGTAALSKLTSRLTRGTIIPAEGESIALEVTWKAPDRWLQVIGAADEDRVRAGFDGTVGWTQDARGPAREVAGGLLASVRHSGAFFQQGRIHDLYPKMTLKGPGKIGDREVQVIEAARADGSPETLYFAQDTGLLIRRDVARQTTRGRQTTQITYEEYRVVDGVRIPFLTRQRRGATGPALTIKVSEIKHNVAVDDAKFRKPAS